MTSKPIPSPVKWLMLLTPSEFGQCPCCTTGQDIALELRPLPLLTLSSPQCQARDYSTLGRKMLAVTSKSITSVPALQQEPVTSCRQLSPLNICVSYSCSSSGWKRAQGTYCSSAQLSWWTGSRPHGPVLPLHIGSAPSHIVPLLCAPAVAVVVVRPLITPIPLPQITERSICFVPGAVFCGSPNGLLGSGISTRNGSKKRTAGAQDFCVWQQQATRSAHLHHWILSSGTVKQSDREACTGSAEELYPFFTQGLVVQPLKNERWHLASEEAFALLRKCQGHAFPCQGKTYNQFLNNGDSATSDLIIRWLGQACLFYFGFLFTFYLNSAWVKSNFKVTE